MKKLTEGLKEQEEEEWEVENDKLVSKEKMGHWCKELDVEEVVGSRVEKKEAVEGKMGRVGGLVEAEEVVDWIEELEEVEEKLGWV